MIRLTKEGHELNSSAERGWGHELLIHGSALGWFVVESPHDEVPTLARPAIEPRIVRFGVFEIDLAKAELRKHGLHIRIQEQPYQILVALLERPGDLGSANK